MAEQKNMTLKEKAYTYVRKMIENGELLPGETLTEQTITSILAISRTPVREALNVLAEEGLVKLIPNRGAVISIPSFKEVWEIFQIREALEPLAASLAIDYFSKEKLNWYHEKIIESKLNPTKELVLIGDQFHEEIIDECGNGLLRSIVDKLRLSIHRTQHLSERLPGRVQKSIWEHESILFAISKRDAADAAQKMREHIISVRESTLNVLKEPKAKQQSFGGMD